MKLMIDIPEKVVTAIQAGEDYRYDIHTAIAQGIPYEEMPQGDLISRNALREVINNAVDEEIRFDQAWAMGLKYSLKLIDNAPTVPQTIITEFKGCDNCELERPKGEWINEWQEIKGGRTYGACCSLCHINGHSGYNFCPNCGADMRKGSDSE